MGLEYWGAYNRSSVPHMAWAQTNDRRARSELDLTEDQLTNLTDSYGLIYRA